MFAFVVTVKSQIIFFSKKQHNIYPTTADKGQAIQTTLNILYSSQVHHYRRDSIDFDRFLC